MNFILLHQAQMTARILCFVPSDLMVPLPWFWCMYILQPIKSRIHGRNAKNEFTLMAGYFGFTIVLCADGSRIGLANTSLHNFRAVCIDDIKILMSKMPYIHLFFHKRGMFAERCLLVMNFN